MYSQNHIGVKKSYIDNPFDDDEPEEREPHANIIEALGGPEQVESWAEAYRVKDDPVTLAQFPTSVLSAIIDAYQNREALGDEANRHLQMNNFMAKLTGMEPLAEDSYDAGEEMPSIDDESGHEEYDAIMEELGLRRRELEEVRQNVPGLYQPLRSEDIHDLGGPAVPTINTPDDILVDDWLSPEEQDLLLSEPMDIAYQLLKERVSPAAIRHKLEYDTNYESNPKRVKYREQLNQERRKRGIYGSGNQMDISHTQGGKLTLEGEHANRARHFKNRGTLRRVRVR